MIQKPRTPKSGGVKPADAKFIKMNTKKGKASNGQGIVYGAREAGRGTEHFELKHGQHASHSSRKHTAKGDRKKTSEQRIVSG